ncbi:MAG: fimbrillin family protein [Candidatus Cryptobacteroides sp.]
MQTKDRLILLTILLTGLAACRKEVPSDTPLVFADVQTKVGLSTYHEDFQVWGYCLAESGSDIMPGYKVFHDPALGWCYTELSGTEGQELQYWSYSASLYRFHAGAPLLRVKEMDASSLTLQMNATTDILQTSLFTEPCLIKRGDPAFGSTVNLAFVYANAKLNLAFKCASSADVSITDIKLTPPSAYATSGQLELQYDWDRPAVSVKALSVESESTDELAFSNLLIPAGTTDAVQTQGPWYLIPQACAKGQWKMSATIDGVLHEVDFTISKGWEAGRSYLFRFEFTDEARLVFLGSNETLFTGEAPVDGGNHNFS